MALTQDRNVAYLKEIGGSYDYRGAITTAIRIYRGGLVCRKNTGRFSAATAATGRRIAGVCVGFEGTLATGLGVAGGTEYAKLRRNLPVLVNIKTAIRTTTSLGLNVFVSDDQTVGGTAVGTAAARVVAGHLLEFEALDKSTGWVMVGVFGPTNIAV
jgi:hypothetical protein